MTLKFYINTLGCEKNTVDSEGATGILMRAGHEPVDRPSQADVIIVNTCGFINDAKEQSIETIFDMAEVKKEDALLMVSGCLSQRYSNQLYKEMPEVDIFLGVNDYDKLPEILEKHQAGKREKYISDYDRIYAELGRRERSEAPYTASVKISEGCNNVCSYCIIPFIRGGYRDRRMEDILDEIRQLADEGCKEVVLIAQDVSNYGIDLYGSYKLPELLHEVCKIDGIHWVRLMYCYEERITDELIQAMASEPKVCHYIDIPLQHCNDRILKEMNRCSTEASIKDTIGRLRKAMPDIHIRTTMIAGLPGETKEDFAQLEAFVEEMKFERLGVFPYSKEEGTLAATMKGQVRQQTKEKRRDAIMALQCSISLEHNQAKVGQVMEVLVEGQDEDGSYIGRTRYDAPDVDNGVLFTSSRQLEPGDFVEVEIIDAFDYDLVGREVEA
ncbi:MAG: 30S ribosomal protein S12 methylthiotransferase RimO [Firmicutes bacterium]|nr:30S ribosomal protein S12 methylthiotransferase RimO [Bacillota bacterium]MBR7147216.1 30S ribosomal protein S12 methylthiotransferase RimO [Bacillota bacterium]